MFFLLYRIGIAISLHTPLKIAYGFAAFVSTLYCLLSPRDRRAVKENLKIIFPEISNRALDGMTRRIYVNFGKYLVDFFRFSKIDRAYIEKYVKLEGFENLQDALKAGKGVIALSAHIGNWELGAVVLATLGVPLSVVALDHKHSKVNDFFINQRRMKGVGVISIGVALRKCFTAFKENQVIALVGDRDYFDNGITVDFFGKRTILPKGPAVFSRRFNAPMVPIFMIRNDNDTFTLKIGEPIRIVHTTDEHGDLIEATKTMARTIENIIREYPTQWYVFRKFWEKISWKRNGL